MEGWGRRGEGRRKRSRRREQRRGNLKGKCTMKTTSLSNRQTKSNR